MDCKSGESPERQARLFDRAFGLSHCRYSIDGPSGSGTSVAAEDLLINDGGYGEAVEAVGEGLPQLYVEPAFACWNTQSHPVGARRRLRAFLSACSASLTLVIEPVDAVDGGALVVAPEQEEVLWIFDLVGQQETDGFQRLLPPVHIVPQEQVIGFWREAPILKQPQQICVLAMDVACKRWAEGHFQTPALGFGQFRLIAKTYRHRPAFI